MNELANLATLAAARAHLYHFLASIFLALPTEDLLTRVRAPEFRAAFADWVDDAQWNRIGAESLEALVIEYNRLFVVPGASYVPPYESVYTDAVEIEYSPHMISGAGEMPTRVRELLWGPSTVAVERAYAQAGLAVAHAAGMPPDHLGIELQFLARLCDEQTAAWSAEDAPEGARLQNLEHKFLHEHPLRWVTRFRERVDAVAACAFYRVGAQLCESLLRSSAATHKDQV